MNYYAAPMEGLTDRIWRQVHQKWFGAADAPTRYYAPFLSPPENRVPEAITSNEDTEIPSPAGDGLLYFSALRRPQAYLRLS